MANPPMQGWHQATLPWPGLGPTTLDLAQTADWDCLFNAVIARLRHCVGDPAGTTDAAALRMQVLECVTAMEQLQRSRPASG